MILDAFIYDPTNEAGVKKKKNPSVWNTFFCVFTSYRLGLVSSDLADTNNETNFSVPPDVC